MCSWNIIALFFMQFPGNKPGIIEDAASQRVDPRETRRGQNQPAKPTVGENQQNHKVSPVQGADANADGHLKIDSKMIDLNMKPHRIHGQASNNQVRTTFTINIAIYQASPFLSQHLKHMLLFFQKMLYICNNS